MIYDDQVENHWITIFQILLHFFILHSVLVVTISIAVFVLIPLVYTHFPNACALTPRIPHSEQHLQTHHSPGPLFGKVAPRFVPFSLTAKRPPFHSPLDVNIMITIPVRIISEQNLLLAAGSQPVARSRRILSGR